MNFNDSEILSIRLELLIIGSVKFNLSLSNVNPFNHSRVDSKGIPSQKRFL